MDNYQESYYCILLRMVPCTLDEMHAVMLLRIPVEYHWLLLDCDGVLTILGKAFATVFWLCNTSFGCAAVGSQQEIAEWVVQRSSSDLWRKIRSSSCSRFTVFAEIMCLTRPNSFWKKIYKTTDKGNITIVAREWRVIYSDSYGKLCTVNTEAMMVTLTIGLSLKFIDSVWERLA